MAENKKKAETTKRPFVPYNEMTDREKGIWFQGQNVKEKNIKEKMGIFVPHKQKKSA
jgi:hypothetical protein